MASFDMEHISAAIQTLIEVEVEKNIKKVTKTPRCPICFENPFCPVSTNTWKTDVLGIKKSTKCPSTMRNPLCLTCARQHFITKLNNGNPLKCPYNCCTSEKPSNNEICMLYGEPSRDKTDPADIYTWGLLDAYGVLNKICPRCNMECANLEEVRDHNREKCPERLLPCTKCNKLVKFKNIDDHKRDFDESHTFKILR